MSSEPAASPRLSLTSSSNVEVAAGGSEQQKAKLTHELRAMMRDVPISDRLMQVLENLESLAAEDTPTAAEDDPKTQDDA